MLTSLRARNVVDILQSIVIVEDIVVMATLPKENDWLKTTRIITLKVLKTFRTSCKLMNKFEYKNSIERFCYPPNKRTTLLWNEKINSIMQHDSVHSLSIAERRVWYSTLLISSLIIELYKAQRGLMSINGERRLITAPLNLSMDLWVTSR